MWGARARGAGVVARSDAGTALRVEGRAFFSTAGLARVRAGDYRVRVSPGVPVDADTLMLATINCCAERLVGPLSRPIGIWYVERDLASDTFEIVLTDFVGRDVQVGWFVIG
jgi:hypothetical protein